MVSNPDQLIMFRLSGRVAHISEPPSRPRPRPHADLPRPIGYTRGRRSSLRRRLADRLGSDRVRVPSRRPSRAELDPHAYLALEFTVDEER